MSMWQGVIDWFEDSKNPSMRPDSWLGWDAWVATANSRERCKACTPAQPEKPCAHATRHGD